MLVSIAISAFESIFCNSPRMARTSPLAVLIVIVPVKLLPTLIRTDIPHINFGSVFLRPPCDE